MSDAETLVGFVVVALLGSFLYFKHRQRTYRAPESRNGPEWTGHPIDATELKQTLAKVRRDYLAARGTTSGICFHKSLLAFARRTVTSLAYFQDKQGHVHTRSMEL
jgi:hypothetical protein